MSDGNETFTFELRDEVPDTIDTQVCLLVITKLLAKQAALLESLGCKKDGVEKINKAAVKYAFDTMMELIEANQNAETMLTDFLDGEKKK